MERFVRGDAAGWLSAVALFWAAIGASLLGTGLYCLWRWSRSLRSALGAPLHTVHRRLERLGSGDFSAGSTPAPAGQNTVLAWIEEARGRLRYLENERTRVVEQLRRTEQRYKRIGDNCNDVIWLCSLPDLQLTFVSPSIQRQLGWDPADFLARPLSLILSSGEEQRVRAAVEKQLGNFDRGDSLARLLRIELELPHKNGHRIPVEAVSTILCDERGRPNELLGISRDITERRTAEEAARSLALHDPLTNLPNRRLLKDRLAQEIARAQREHLMVALLFIDLDDFKRINDSLGHSAGDWVLQRVAEWMGMCVRVSDTVARIGGDEFVVLLPDLRTVSDAMRVADKIRIATTRPLAVPSGNALTVSCSIGMAVYPVDASDAQTLFRHADDAMYRAKRAGRSGGPVSRDASRGLSSAYPGGR